jgi:hypothetical protein
MRNCVLTVCILGAIACGTSTDGDGTPGSGSSSGSSGMQSSGGTGDGGTSSNDAKVPFVVPDGLLGVWKVDGKDSRGSYTGEAELRAESGAVKFSRAVAYKGVTVEDNRELHWVWTGAATKKGAAEVSIVGSLEPRGFVRSKGTTVRALTDSPITIVGSASVIAGEVRARYTVGTETMDEVWSAPKPTSTQPIVTWLRTETPSHAPPSANYKQTSFTSFSSFHALPSVAPYAMRPDFNAAVHTVVDDATDFDFYRANQNALRIWNKPVDAVSLTETKSRANAFRWPLLQKAKRYEQDIEAMFIDPSVGMMLSGGPVGGAKSDSYDSALWTSTYLAGQAYQFEVTGDAAAKARALRSVDALLKLQEITGDWKVFARSIRKAKNNGDPGWIAGTGAFATLEWLTGGNNDMLKGLLYGYAVGYMTFCKSGTDAICTRIRANAKHLADDVSTSQGFNELNTNWLAAVTSDNILDKTKYRGKAEGFWTAGKAVIRADATQYTQGIADWSGTHLNFISNCIAILLANEVDLGGDAKGIYTNVVANSYANVKGQRLVVWDLLAQAYGAAKIPAATTEATAVLRELPCPKSQVFVDHTVSPSFSLSPYPYLPWKNDWTVNNRTQALTSFPYFELPNDEMFWKSRMQYIGNSEGLEAPGADFVHAYWFGRKHGVFTGSATE